LADNSKAPIALLSMSLKHGKLGTEKDALDISGFGGIRSKSERAMFALVPKGVRATAVCFPPTVHGDGDKGFVHNMIKAAEKHRVSAYVNDGQNSSLDGNRHTPDC
jgi:hypothetical protein